MRRLSSSPYSLYLREGYGAELCRAHLLVGRSVHYEGCWELAAMHRIPRRRLLAHDGEHEASADLHVDELASVPPQHHHPLEPSAFLEAPLVAAGVLAAFQFTTSLADLIGAVLSVLHGELSVCRPAATPPGRALHASGRRPAPLSVSILPQDRCWVRCLNHSSSAFPCGTCEPFPRSAEQSQDLQELAGQPPITRSSRAWVGGLTTAWPPWRISTVRCDGDPLPQCQLHYPFPTAHC
jgi:hypothetical protein